ncbi:DUF7504 family protein [Natrarchaeobius chitinivorans]|uniref:DUF835 domain-containing protein n=1 Tax=Natrarchaeobius chitinivorans TaxID=1679083 RepID=A0A3N6LWW1_NATCH|nr:hypothetical protein [Natrarchaeobius chitinivorans]RQG95188.1 hypothetical protein EA473_09580 [Natrarchaeobius chitinivorans]
MNLNVSSDVESPTNLLVLDGETGDRRPCAGVHSASEDAAVLVVTLGSDPPDGSLYGETDNFAGSIVVGQGDAVDESDFDAAAVVDSVPDPTDLSAIGTAVLRACTRRSEAGRETAICFDAVDGLLEGVSPNAAFQFVHALTDRLSRLEVHAHFHVDPTRHGDQLVTNLEELFDATVTVDHTTDIDELPDPKPDSQPSESGNATVSEATDDDVAAAFSDGGEASTDGSESTPAVFSQSQSVTASQSESPTEATDETVAKRFADGLEGPDEEFAVSDGGLESDASTEGTESLRGDERDAEQ